MATSKVLLGLLVFSHCEQIYTMALPPEADQIATLVLSDPEDSSGRDYIIGARAKSVTLLYNLDRNVLKSDPSQTANGTSE